MRTSESSIYKSSNLEVNHIHDLLKDLGNRNGLVRETAREKLVEIGSPVIEFLSELISRPDDTVRWESIKALSEIANPVSIPTLIQALYDIDEEVRWIAAEGLVAIGRDAIEPLLNELLENPRSFRLKRGVHHVLTGLGPGDKNLDFTELIKALDEHSTKIHLPAVTYRVLRTVRKLKSEKKPARVRPRLH